jgi:hypothetical protein
MFWQYNHSGQHCADMNEWESDLGQSKHHRGHQGVLFQCFVNRVEYMRQRHEIHHITLSCEGLGFKGKPPDLPDYTHR